MEKKQPEKEVSPEKAASDIFLAETALMRRLKVYLQNNKNVLFVGKKGVGKTSIVTALWEDAGLNYKFFSAATMDPWVDFIGVPREQIGDNGARWLELIRPKEFQDDSIEALFFDEFNRAPKKIRNAVMELIQFKSINGKKFKNLKVIWAAINPEDDEDEEYDVEPLDPAQKDRFHIQVALKYEPSQAYFAHKYGSETAEVAITWWHTIKDPTILNEVSPRRLDYALEIANLSGGSLDDVLPKASNPSALKQALKQRPALAMLRSLKKNKDVAGAREFLEDDNNFYCVAPEIIKTDGDMDFFLELLDSERLNSLISKESAVQNWCYRVYKTNNVINNALTEIVQVGTNRLLTQTIKKKFQQAKLRDVAAMPDNPSINPKHADITINAKPEKTDYSAFVRELKNKELKNTYMRAQACKELSANIPADFSIDDAKDTLAIINGIAGQTHSKYIKEWSKFLMGVINACVKKLADDSYKFSTFKDNYGDLLKYVISEKGFYFKIEETCKKKVQVITN